MRLLVAIGFLLLASCASYPVSNSLDSAVAAAVAKRFRLSEPPIFVSDPKSCAAVALTTVATISVASLQTAAAPGQYKSGVFVLCNAIEDNGSTSAILQRVLYHASLSSFVVSETGRIELEKSRGGWRVLAMPLTAIDY